MRTHRNIAIAAATIAIPTTMLAAVYSNGALSSATSNSATTNRAATAAPHQPQPVPKYQHLMPDPPPLRPPQSTAEESRRFVQAPPTSRTLATNATTGSASAGQTTAWASYRLAGAASGRTTGAPTTPHGSPLSSIADSIQVRFQGYKDMNGIYRLNEDETVSISGVGRISIAGMTAADLERELARRIMGSTGRLAPVSVEVSTYRHVYVDGIVAKPGSFQWQRGMTVIKAVTMTGGIFRPASQSALGSSPVAQRGQLDIARLDLAQALIRQARTKAELNDEKLLRLPERLIGIFGRNRANEMLATEQSVLDNRRATLKARLAAVDAQQVSIRAEIKRLQILATGMSARTQNYAGLLKKLRRTYRAGEISNRRLFEVESKLGDLEEKVASTNVQLVRARSALQLLESRRTELTETRREKLIDQDIRTKNAIETYQIKYDMALDAMRSVTSGGAIAPRTATSASPLRYEIIRRTKKGEQRLDAKPLDVLMPGDTLVVSRIDDADVPGRKSEANDGKASKRSQTRRTTPPDRT